MFDEEPIQKAQPAHSVGEDLSALSVDELDRRIQSLLDEIERLKAEKKAKQQSQAAADAFFKS